MAKTIAKSKKPVDGKVQHPLIISAILLYLAINMSNFFNPPVNPADPYAPSLSRSAYQTAGLLLFLFAIGVFFDRRNITHKVIVRMLKFYVAVFLVIFGLTMCSYSQSPLHIQDDGYTVTGGFLVLAGGLSLGYEYAKLRFTSNGKK